MEAFVYFFHCGWSLVDWREEGGHLMESEESSGLRRDLWDAVGAETTELLEAMGNV